MVLAEVGHWLCDREARSEPRMSQPEVLQRDNASENLFYPKGLSVCMERNIEAVVTNTNGILFKCTKALLQRNDFCFFIELIPLFAAPNCTVGKEK